MGRAWAWVWGAWLCAGGCSWVLDVPADCADGDCGGYLCNTEGTGCLYACATDRDCADGFLCDRGSCEAWSCAPDGELQELAEGATSTRDVNPAWGDDGGLGGQLGLAQVLSGTLSVQLFQGQGLVPGAARVLEASSAKPQTPWMAWAGDGWGLVWVATISDAQGPKQHLRFAVLDTQANLVVAPKSVWVTTTNPRTGEVEKSIDDPKLVWDGAQGRFLVTWSTRISASEIFLMALDPQGRDLLGRDEVPHEAGVRLTRGGSDAIDPYVIPVAGRVYDVAYRQGSPRVDVLLRRVDLGGTQQGADVNVSSTQGRVGSHALVPISTGSVVGFSEESGGGTGLFRAQLLTDRSLAGGQTYAIDRDFEEVADAISVSSPRGEYGVVFVATQGGERQVFLARFKDDGSRVGLPIPTSQERLRMPIRPRAVGTEGGYFLLHQESEGPKAGSIFGRHWTCAAD